MKHLNRAKQVLGDTIRRYQYDIEHAIPEGDPWLHLHENLPKLIDDTRPPIRQGGTQLSEWVLKNKDDFYHMLGLDDKASDTQI
jgi:hypothetical protein